MRLLAAFCTLILFASCEKEGEETDVFVTVKNLITLEGIDDISVSADYSASAYTVDGFCHLNFMLQNQTLLYVNFSGYDWFHIDHGQDLTIYPGQLNEYYVTLAPKSTITIMNNNTSSPENVVSFKYRMTPINPVATEVYSPVYNWVTTADHHLYEVRNTYAIPSGQYIFEWQSERAISGIEGGIDTLDLYQGTNPTYELYY